MSNDYSAASSKAEQMHAVVKSIREFDKHKVEGVLSSILGPTDRENCFLGTYYRAVGNVDSLLALNSGKHFQAAAMLARALFELAVDVKLIDMIPQGWAKMIFSVDVEKLRTARKMIDFAKANPDRKIDVSAQTQFVTKQCDRIEHNHKTLWPPSPKRPGSPRPKHWSGKALPERAKLVGHPFDEMYNFQYPRLSWYVHAGLTGIMNLPSDFFPMVHGYALSLAIACYSQILESVIRELKIDCADKKVYNTLRYATLLPFTRTPEEETALFHDLLG